MGRIVVIAEHDNQRLNGATAKCVQCAASVPGAQIHVLVFGKGAAAVAEQAARLAGVAGVTLVDSPAYEHPLAAVIAPAAAELAAGATHVFGPSTTFGKDLMPRIAALLDVGQVSDIMAVEGERRFRRPVYAGNAIVTVEVNDAGPVVGTVRIASYPAAAGRRERSTGDERFADRGGAHAHALREPLRARWRSAGSAGRRPRGLRRSRARRARRTSR